METFKLEAEATYVALYRISTNSNRQTLSLEFQKDAILEFMEKTGGILIKEFTEEISGEDRNRKDLAEAIRLCLSTDSTLIVHSLSRLSRLGLEAVSMLNRHKVKYFEVSAPYDSEFVKGIKLLQANQENDNRNASIQAALHKIKSNIKQQGFHISKMGNKITKLGKPENLKQTARDVSIKVRNKKAKNNPNNKRALTILVLLLPHKLSLSVMAIYLNDEEFKTSTGKKFTPKAISNLLKLYGKSREVLEESQETKKLINLKPYYENTLRSRCRV